MGFDEDLRALWEVVLPEVESAEVVSAVSSFGGCGIGAAYASSGPVGRVYAGAAAVRVVWGVVFGSGCECEVLFAVSGVVEACEVWSEERSCGVA